MERIQDPELINCSRVELLDVRPVLAGGHEPFGMIKQTVEQLSAGDVVLLIAPFNPIPLKKFLETNGYALHYYGIDPESHWLVIYKGDAGEVQEQSAPGPDFVIPAPSGMIYFLDGRECSSDLIQGWVGGTLDQAGEDDLIVLHMTAPWDGIDEFPAAQVIRTELDHDHFRLEITQTETG